MNLWIWTVKRVYDATAEQSLIGSILRYPAILDEITLSANDFYNEWAKVIYEVCRELHQSNRLSANAVVGWLEHKGDLEQVGGAETIRNMVESGFAPTLAKEYADRIRLLSSKRKGLMIAQKMQDLTQEFNGTEGEYVTEIHTLLSELESNDSGNMSAITEYWTEHIESKKTGKKIETPNIGIASIDYWMNGIGNNRLIIIAGRPGTGKTALMLQSCMYISRQGFGAVPIFSMEMSKEELTDRLAANLSGIPFSKIYRNELTAEEIKKIDGSKGLIKDSLLYINDTPRMDMRYIASQSRMLKRKHGKLGAIAIDYLGLMEMNRRGNESLTEAIGRITREAKLLAKELGCSIFLLTQMNREIEKRNTKRPVLSDLKDSGSIEQDADMVIFLHKNDEKSTGKLAMVDLIVAKGRQTGIRDFELVFAGEVQRIAEKAVYAM